MACPARSSERGMRPGNHPSGDAPFELSRGRIYGCPHGPRGAAGSAAVTARGRPPPHAAAHRSGVALDLERVGDAGAAVDLPGDVDLIVLGVEADPPGAPEPLPEPELALLLEARGEDQRSAAYLVVAPRLLTDAVEVDGVRLPHALGKLDPRLRHGPDHGNRRAPS